MDVLTVKTFGKVVFFLGGSEMKKVIVCLVILCFGSQAFALTAVGSPSADDGWNSMFEDGVQQIYVSGNNQKFGREESDGLR